MMQKNVFLYSSLTLNAMLGALLIFGRPAPAEQSVASPARAASNPEAAATEGPAQLVEKALRAGIPEHLAYQLALLSVRDSTATRGEQYWRSPADRIAPQPTADREADDAARTALLRSFGPAARERPEFAAMFDQQANRFHYLPSQKQVELQRIISQPAAAPDRSDSRLAVLNCPVGLCGEVVAQIRVLLTDDEYFEYRLRESPLAAQLAGNGFDFTEQEFRAVFKVLGRTPGTSSAISSGVAAQLAQVLGEDRFRQYERTTDPAYRLVQKATQQHPVSRAALDAAYDAIKRSERKLAEAGASSPQTRAAIFQTRDQALQASLSPESVAVLLLDLQNSSLSTQVSSPEIPRPHLYPAAGLPIR